MAWRYVGSLSRSLVSASRASSLRSPPPLPRFRSPTISAPRLHNHRRLSFAPSRNLGELGCAMSFLPLHCTLAVPCLTSHLSVGARASCELSHGTFCRTCQDR